MRHNLGRKTKSNQLGQAMIEYTIVVLFGILILTTGPMKDVIVELFEAIENNYKGYSYAISLNDLPMADKERLYEKLLDSMNVEQELKDTLVDDPQKYHAAIKKYNIPNPPSPKNIINKLKDEAKKKIRVF